MKIWLDLDEVLCSLMKPWLKRCKKELWLDLKFEDVTSYALWEIPTVKHSKKEIVKVFAKMIEDDYKNWHNILEPIPGSVGWVRKLKDIWWELIIITSRPAVLKSATFSWLEKYFWWLIDEVIFTNLDINNLNIWNKQDFLKKLELDVFIEDNFDNVKNAIDFVKKVFLFKKPWNKHLVSDAIHPKLAIIEKWDDVFKYL